MFRFFKNLFLTTIVDWRSSIEVICSVFQEGNRKGQFIHQSSQFFKSVPIEC